MKVVLLTRPMPAANALIRRLLALDALHLTVVEMGAPRVSGARGLARRVLAAARRRLLEPSGRALERRALARVYGPRAAPLEPGLPVLFTPRGAWAGPIRVLEAIRPELIVVFGTSLLPEALTRTARLAAINLHAGLAPGYRGIACVEQALLAGRLEDVGVTLHRVRSRIDGGELIAQARPTIVSDDDERTVVHRVHDLGHALLSELIERLRAGAELRPEPQGEVGRLYQKRDFGTRERRRLRALVRAGLFQRPILEPRRLLSLDDTLPGPRARASGLT